ncbi:MAG: FecR family protein [Candidatus Cryptobacteroides sp.]
MLKRDFRIAFLIVKEIAGGLSEEEQGELESWKDSHHTSYENLHSPEELRKHTSEMISFSREAAWAKIDARIRRRKMIRGISIAAAIVLPLLAIAGLLTMPSNEEAMPVMAVVTTGRGEEKTVILPDGTSVNLNSLSRITYPGTFSGECRTVSLEGEALFNVTTTNIPFVVSTESMRIEVLGTSFDVYAYSGKTARTVLLKGSVRISSGSGDCILSPGQMASVSGEEGTIRIDEVDADFYASWTQGKIFFRDERLEDIMDELSRLYEFEVEYGSDAVKNLRFGCYVDRFDDITSFLDLLRRTGKIRVETVDGHKLLINNN